MDMIVSLPVLKNKFFVMKKAVVFVKDVAENGTGWVEIKSFLIDGTHQLSSAWGVAPQNFM